IVTSEGCGGHPELIRRLEVVENLSPGALVLGTPPVALIDDDQVKEVRGILLVQTWPSFVLGDRLIDREVDVSPIVDDAILDLEAGFIKRSKVLVLGVVDEDIPIGKIENFRTAVGARPIPASIPELPADLEGDESFARSGGHGEEE